MFYKHLHDPSCDLFTHGEEAPQSKEAQLQAALDAEREKVKELVANQAEYEKCTDEQITALNQGCLDYEKQLATLQAQLRQVEGERDEWERKCRDLCQAHGALLIEHHDIKKELTTLRQLVAALPVAGLPVEHARSDDFVVLQANGEWMVHTYNYWAKFATEDEARAYIALLEYRASLPAQPAQGGA